MILLTTIAVGLMAAFVGGFIAKRIGLPTIVGYIVAGVVLGGVLVWRARELDVLDLDELAEDLAALLEILVHFEIDIQDHGLGIPPKELPKLPL